MVALPPWVVVIQLNVLYYEGVVVLVIQFPGGSPHGEPLFLVKVLRIDLSQMRTFVCIIIPQKIQDVNHLLKNFLGCLDEKPVWLLARNLFTTIFVFYDCIMLLSL